MGLTSSLNIGHSALTASQLAIQVTGHNLANVATPGYTRQLPIFSPVRGSSIPGQDAGRGVRIADVRRQVDEALRARLFTSISRQNEAQQQLSIVSQLESTLNELSGFDVSSQLTEFFGVWSEGGNLTEIGPTIVQQGEALAGHLRLVRRELTAQRDQLDDQLGAMVERADAILDEIGKLNSEIVNAEGSGGTASALRDQRDRLVSELSELMDVNTIEQRAGNIDVFVGSIPMVLGGDSRGLEMRTQSNGSQLEVTVNVRADGRELPVMSGRIRAMLNNRDAAIDDTIEKLDTLAANLIFEVNRLHSTGVNQQGWTALTGTLAVSPTDRTLALNDPNNQSLASLPFAPTNGGFFVNVTNSTTGATETVRIEVDLDGIDSSGQRSFADDTSLTDIQAALDAIPGVTARILPDGRLDIAAAPGSEISFSEDTSGVLATLGVNSFFTGTSAGNIAVRDDLVADPTQLALGRFENGTFVENGTAIGIAELQTTALGQLGGSSLGGFWTSAVSRVGVLASSAANDAEATRVVRESLEAQDSAVSGVSVDEESVNLINYQRAYEGAARFISIVDELTQTLISLV
jgi:flagellar hook-associated protein 1 FlgK